MPNIVFEILDAHGHVKQRSLTPPLGQSCRAREASDAEVRELRIAEGERYVAPDPWLIPSLEQRVAQGITPRASVRATSDFAPPDPWQRRGSR